MNNYILMVRASWITSVEHPLGHSPNIISKRSKSLQRTFDSPSDESARRKAKKMIAEFKKGLPKVKLMPGWNSSLKPEVKSQILARILPL